jgi:hypothetical protein
VTSSDATGARAALRARLDRATADLDPPFAVVDLPAFDRNAALARPENPCVCRVSRCASGR